MPDCAAHVAGALARARLDGRADDRVSGFSRGMRQRLALERALVHGPRLVLLDEPFTGLDDESAGLLVERLHGLRQSGAITLMATHDFDYAEEVATRAACLDRGRLHWIAPGAGSLRDRYRQTLQAVAAGMRDVLRAAWLIARKDLVIEARSREIVYTTLFFAVASLLIFAFGFVKEGRADADAAAAILWVSLAFAGHAGARPHVRARAGGRDAARADSRAGRAARPCTSASCSRCCSSWPASRP